MAVKILRRGSEGTYVKRWQTFLVGQNHLHSNVDGDFGAKTETATKAFQRSQGLGSDGIVGGMTLGAALMLGFDLGFSDPQRGDQEELLPGRSAVRPASSASARERMFGKFKFEPAPTRDNPEKIKILDDWESENIEPVFLPQLKGKLVYGRASSGNMRFHKAAAQQLKDMWAAWEQAGVIDCVRTYGGSFNPRFIRGSRSKLSNHAFGSAFDINSEWNRLGAVPTAAGREGSVRELVDIANEYGFHWGGHYKGRADGMHFEVARIL